MDINHFDNIYQNFEQGTYKSKYYDIDSLNSHALMEAHDLSVFYHNICSLYPKQDAVQSYLSRLNFDMNVLCFVESWLNESTRNLVNFNGCNDYHSLRDSKKGGGISLYIQSKFRSKLLPGQSSVTDVIESLFVELQASSTRVFIGVIYRPPNSDPSQFILSLIHI